MILASQFDGLMSALWLAWAVALLLGISSLIWDWKRSRWFPSCLVTGACSTALGWFANDAKNSFGTDNAFFWACASVSVGLVLGWLTLLTARQRRA